MHSVSCFSASVFYIKIIPAASVLVRSQGFLKGPKDRFTQDTVLGDNF